MGRLHPSSSSTSSDRFTTVSSGSSSLEKKSILCICMYVYTVHGDVYRERLSIDPTNADEFYWKDAICWKEEETDEISKVSDFLLSKPPVVFRIPSCIPESATFVAVKSNIYALGGLRDGELARDAYVCDMAATAADDDWKPLPLMITPRCKPDVVALDGKLYVMGSIRNNSDFSRVLGPWSEVYDIHSNRWTPLDDYAPFDQSGRADYVCVNCVLVVPKDRSITPYDIMIANFDRDCETYFYCPKLNQWKTVELPIEFKHTTKECIVAVEQVLFMATSKYLCAYDLVNDPDENIETTFATYKCTGFPRPQARMIKGLEEEYPLKEKYPLSSGCGKELVHLGNMDFCIVWPSIDKDSACKSKTTIHCLKFRVDKDEWLASVLSHDRYCVPLEYEVDWGRFEQCMQVLL